MLCFPKKVTSVSLLALTLLLIPAAAFSAAENSPTQPETPAAASEAKSYLPPWMQKQDRSEGKIGSGPDKTVASPSGTPVAEDAAKKKARFSSQGPRSQHRAWRQKDAFFLRGFAGIFGR